MNARTKWPLVLASVPLWPIVWLFAFWALARLKLGYWPVYGHPDPADLPWPLLGLDFAVLPLLLLAPVAVLAFIAACIHAWYRRRWDWRLVLTPAAFLLFVAWLRFDPGGLFEWWID